MINVLLLCSLAFGEEPTVAPVAETAPTEIVEQVEETAPVAETEEKSEEPKVEEKSEEPKVEEQALPTTDAEAVEDAIAFWKALETQNWSLAGGFFVMLVVYIFNRLGLKDKIGGKAVPYVSVVLGILTAVGVSLASGLSIGVAIESGLVAGLTAIGSWETIFKKFLA